MADARELLDHWDTMQRIYSLPVAADLRLQVAQEHYAKFPHAMSCNGVLAMRRCVDTMEADVLKRLHDEMFPPPKEEDPGAKPEQKARPKKPARPAAKRKPVVKRSQA